MRGRRERQLQRRRFNWRGKAKTGIQLVLLILVMVGVSWLMTPPDEYTNIPDCPEMNEILTEEVTLKQYGECFIDKNLGKVGQDIKETMNRILSFGVV